MKDETTARAEFEAWARANLKLDGVDLAYAMYGQRGRRCITKDCENHTHQGRFIGDLCAPCHSFITEAEGQHSQAFRNALATRALGEGK